MLQISPEAIESRLAKDNPWWSVGRAYKSDYHSASRRTYFDPFFRISTDLEIKRSALLLGPRRVGKTVILNQIVDQLIRDGISPHQVMYVSIDAPVYARIPLENYLTFAFSQGDKSLPYYVMFDEIQYLTDWETHLKDLVDRYPNVKFIVSGSAGAALQLKSKESGAGRFSDFLLPPLTFHEFISFLKKDGIITKLDNDYLNCNDLGALNDLFIDYLNYGGFPELALNMKMRSDTGQYIRNDIIDKVLLKDLPNLYGITNISELNNLFSFLAYNTGQEASLEAISQNSGLSKPTITDYIEYLRSSFLVSTISKMPSSSKGILRKRNFKIYLVNPSMRSALFGEVKADETEIVGHLAESAVLSQWHHISKEGFHYYHRDKHGNEVDLVSVKQGTFHPSGAVEVKWSDRTSAKDVSQIRGLIGFAKKAGLEHVIVTSRTNRGSFDADGIRVVMIPTSIYCLNLGAMTSKMAIDFGWNAGPIAAE